MSDWEKCERLQELPGLFSKNDPLPQDFLAHSQSCEICLFWTSWSLAIHKAIMTTDRLFYKPCPSSSRFEMLLFGVIYGARKEGVEKINKNIFHVSDIRLKEAVAHINRDNPSYCQWCRMYFDDLFDKSVNYQQEFARQLTNCEEIKYPPERTALEINADDIGYDPKKKPN